jgi:hypothetical protein
VTRAAFVPARAVAVVAAALISLLGFVGVADAVVLDTRGNGHVRLGLPLNDGCAERGPTRIVVEGMGATTVNTTGRVCDRFPNDAFDRGNGWVQRGQAGRSVIVPHFDVGVHKLRFSAFRDGRKRARGRIRYRARYKREFIFEDEPDFQRYCIGRNKPLHGDPGARYCIRIRRNHIVYGATTALRP